jgi:hypothetical protein
MTRTYRAAWAVKLPLATSKVISRIQLTSSPMPSATPATPGCGHRLGSPRAARPAGPRPIAAPVQPRPGGSGSRFGPAVGTASRARAPRCAWQALATPIAATEPSRLFRVCRGGHVDDQSTRQGFESLTLTNAVSKDRSGRTRPAESVPRPRGRLGPAPGRVPRRAPDPQVTPHADRDSPMVTRATCPLRARTFFAKAALS